MKKNITLILVFSMTHFCNSMIIPRISHHGKKAAMYQLCDNKSIIALPQKDKSTDHYGLKFLLTSTATKKEKIKYLNLLLSYEGNNRDPAKQQREHIIITLRNMLIDNKDDDVKKIFYTGDTTIFHIAAIEDIPELITASPVHTLFDGYIDKKDKNDNSALYIAAKSLHLSTAKTLINYDANVNTRNEFGRSALIGALLKKYYDPETFDHVEKIISYLYYAGANPQLKDNDGHSFNDYLEELLDAYNYTKRKTIYALYGYHMNHFEALKKITSSSRE